MKIRRRTILKGLSLIPVYPLRGFAQASPANAVSPEEAGADEAFREAYAELRRKAVAFHQDLGYREVAPAPLVTGHPFNGGLRHDAYEALHRAAAPAFVIQDLARIGDISERERHDILPYFNVLFCNWVGKTEAAAVDETLDFLIQVAGFSPTRLAVVSVRVLAPHREKLASHGIDWQRQVVIRDDDEARLAGDGSGYFRPTDHPNQLDVPSIGFYAWLGDDPPPAVETYPLAERWTEIGEIDLDPKMSAAQGFGLERLVYAATGLFPSWHDRRAHLLARIEAEVSASGTALPEGYDRFKSG